MHVPLAETDSTNIRAKALLTAGVVAPFSVTASIQTAGQGQRGKVWQSAQGNYFGTFVVPDKVSPFLSAVMVRETIQHFCPDDCVQIKWPNDILLNSGKVSGILTEVFKEHTIIGVGINSKCHPECNEGPVLSTSLQAESEDPSTQARSASLAQDDHYRFGKFSTPVAAEHVHYILQIKLDTYKNQSCYDRYLKHLAWLNQPVTLTNNTTHQGTLTGVTKEGAIQINAQTFLNGSLRLHK